MTKAMLHFRRRRENKTDYKKRLSLIRSGVPRLVIRQTNSRIVLQIVGYSPKGDVTHVNAASDELSDYGWKHSGKNLPACYLTGILCAQKAKKKKIAEAIVDLGLKTPLKGSRMFAAVKGALDGGLKVPADAEIFPPAERITGKHIKDSIPKDMEEAKAKLLKA